jgi:hypothetical protein
MIWHRLIRGFVAAALISAGVPATAAGTNTASAQTDGARGYAYICDGQRQVEEVKEPAGYEVAVVDSLGRPNSPNDMFEVFQASRPERCAAMAAPLAGAVPGTLLVAVTWAAPQLRIVRSLVAKPDEVGVKSCGTGTVRATAQNG